MSAADVAMEPAGPEPAAAAEPTEAKAPEAAPETTAEPVEAATPTPAPADTPMEPAVATPAPERPKRRSRAPERTIRAPKRVNNRTATPPSIVVDQAFWSGLLATHRAMKREGRTQRYSNFAIA